ncbi:MAG: glycosyltransferase family 2 protein [Proteobacteria bacterium]|jgi:glycosyltransferase involved in cell wall biosynthesis|nr:glycosyltransferase family 2 protein [Pseudomonadota bacterium]
MKTSIILATYNWDKALDIILYNLSKQLKKKSDIEIIIADDGSNSATDEIIKKYQMKFECIKHVWHEDIGFRKASILNKAAALSTGDYLIFLDGDCIPFTDYISEHIDLAENKYFVAGNRVLLSRKFTQEVLNQPQIINNVVKWRLFHWLFAKFKKNVNKISPRLKIKNGKWRYWRSQNWKYPKGCNFALWRSDFMAVNGFDEEFSGWGHEDADLFIRLLHSGVKIKDGRFSVPVLHLWHKESERSREKSNKDKLLQRVDDVSFIQAQSGISQYLSK